MLANNDIVDTPMHDNIMDFHENSRDISVSESDPDDSEPEEAKSKEDRHFYRLMHRRFGHYGPILIGKLHKVANLKTKISIPPPNRRVCKSCKLGKMRNTISKTRS